MLAFLYEKECMGIFMYEKEVSLQVLDSKKGSQQEATQPVYPYKPYSSSIFW